MAKPMDVELKKAFMDLQVKMVETHKKIKTIDTQISILKRLQQHVDYTERELNSLPPETKTYESVGRMFILKDLDQVKSNMKNRHTSLNTRATVLVKSKEHLEKNLKESEDNIREMVQLRKEQNEANY